MFCFTVFAWQAYERGADVHLEADPTKLALLSKEFKVKKEEHEKGQKESIVEQVRHCFRFCCIVLFFPKQHH